VVTPAPDTATVARQSQPPDFNWPRTTEHLLDHASRGASPELRS